MSAQPTLKPDSKPYEVGTSVYIMGTKVDVYEQHGCKETSFGPGTLVTITEVGSNATTPQKGQTSADTIPVSKRKYRVKGVIEVEVTTVIAETFVPHVKLFANPLHANSKELPYKVGAKTRIRETFSINRGQTVLSRGDEVVITDHPVTLKGSAVYSTTSLSIIQYPVAKMEKQIESRMFVGSAWVLHENLALPPQ